MSWTYEILLATSRDKLRLLIGDTLSADQQFSDEELDWLLTENGDGLYRTAAAACRALATRYSRYADKWVGDLKILASQKARGYLAMAQELDTKSSSMSWAVPTAGGVYVAEKEAATENTALVQPEFSRGMMTNAGS